MSDAPGIFGEPTLSLDVSPLYVYFKRLLDRVRRRYPPEPGDAIGRRLDAADHVIALLEHWGAQQTQQNDWQGEAVGDIARALRCLHGPERFFWAEEDGCEPPPEPLLFALRAANLLYEIHGWYEARRWQSPRRFALLREIVRLRGAALQRFPHPSLDLARLSETDEAETTQPWWRHCGPDPHFDLDDEHDQQPAEPDAPLARPPLPRELWPWDETADANDSGYWNEWDQTHEEEEQAARAAFYEAGQLLYYEDEEDERGNRYENDAYDDYDPDDEESLWHWRERLRNPLDPCAHLDPSWRPFPYLERLTPPRPHPLENGEQDSLVSALHDLARACAWRATLARMRAAGKCPPGAPIANAPALLAEADRVFRRALELATGCFGPYHWRRAHQLKGYAEFLSENDRPAEAEVYERAERAARAVAENKWSRPAKPGEGEAPPDADSPDLLEADTDAANNESDGDDRRPVSA